MAELDFASGSPDQPIADFYVVERSKPLGDLGGLPAFAATDLSQRRPALICAATIWMVAGGNLDGDCRG